MSFMIFKIWKVFPIKNEGDIQEWRCRVDHYAKILYPVWQTEKRCSISLLPSGTIISLLPEFHPLLTTQTSNSEDFTRTLSVTDTVKAPPCLLGQWFTNFFFPGPGSSVSPNVRKYQKGKLLALPQSY